MLINFNLVHVQWREWIFDILFVCFLNKFNVKSVYNLRSPSFHVQWQYAVLFFWLVFVAYLVFCGGACEIFVRYLIMLFYHQKLRSDCSKQSKSNGCVLKCNNRWMKIFYLRISFVPLNYWKQFFFSSSFITSYLIHIIQTLSLFIFFSFFSDIFFCVASYFRACIFFFFAIQNVLYI